MNNAIGQGEYPILPEIKIPLPVGDELPVPVIQGGISYNDRKPFMRNLGRALLPKKVENWFLGSQEDEDLLNKYSDSDLPTSAEIAENYKNGLYSKDDVLKFSDLRTNYDNAKANREYTDVRNANIGQGIVDIGSAAIGGGGAAATKAGINMLKPYVGRKIAQGITQGALGGALGGAAHGFGTGLVQEDVNPFSQALIEGGIGTVAGAGLGYGTSQIGKNLALKGIRNNVDDAIRQQQYFDDYIEGLSDNSRLGEQSLLNKEFSKLRTAREGLKPQETTSSDLLDSLNPRHRLQADLINEYNPAPDDYHTWIRNADDIYNFEDTLKPPNFDSDFIGNDFDPSYSWDMAQDAIKNGEIDVYSSYPIDKGVFVTPSTMEAKAYSGTGKIYNKRVPLKDVAWIDAQQGQYAPIDDFDFQWERTHNPEFARIEENYNKKNISNLYDKIINNDDLTPEQLAVKLNWNNAEKSNWKGTKANGKYGKSKSRYYNNQKYRDWNFDIRVSDHNKALKGCGQWSDDSYREIDFDGIKVKINEDFFNGDDLDIVVDSITDFNKIKSKLNKYLQKQIPIIYENELHSVMPNIYK